MDVKAASMLLDETAKEGKEWKMVVGRI